MALGSETTCIEQARAEKDSDRGLFADLLTAANIAAAGYQTATAVKIALDEYGLAKKYWRISQNWLDYYRDYYAPVEDQELAEAAALKAETPHYDTARGRARLAAWLEFRGVVEHALRCTSKYCTGLREDMLADILSTQGAALAMADGLGYRNERAYLESRDDIRFEKQFNTAKRGRDMVADNVNLAKATAGIYGDLYKQAWDGLVGAGTYLGYKANRNKTKYPVTFMQSRAAVARSEKTDEVKVEIGPGIEMPNVADNDFDASIWR